MPQTREKSQKTSRAQNGNSTSGYPILCGSAHKTGPETYPSIRARKAVRRPVRRGKWESIKSVETIQGSLPGAAPDTSVRHRSEPDSAQSANHRSEVRSSRDVPGAAGFGDIPPQPLYSPVRNLPGPRAAPPVGAPAHTRSGIRTRLRTDGVIRRDGGPGGPRHHLGRFAGGIGQAKPAAGFRAGPCLPCHLPARRGRGRGARAGAARRLQHTGEPQPAAGPVGGGRWGRPAGGTGRGR